MSSKFSHIGEILFDHRDSPGLTEQEAHQAGLPAGAGKGVFQADTYTCRHCCRVVVMNPQRQRDRAYCSHCDAWICDWCGAEMAKTGECRPFRKIIEEVQEAAGKGLTVSATPTDRGLIITTDGRTKEEIAEAARKPLLIPAS